MDCHPFKLLIQRYHDGGLSKPEMAEYEHHGRACSRCARLDKDYARVFAALDRIELYEPSGDFNRLVLSRVDISRYRVSAARKIMRSIGSGWSFIPFPVRLAGALAASLAAVIVIYKPFLDFIISFCGDAVIVLETGLMTLREIIERSGELIDYLGSATNYRVAGETLLSMFRKLVSGIPPSYIILAVAALVFALIVVIRAARTTWRKGETHVGIF